MKQVLLPWPDKRLNPNARIHFAQKSKVFAEAKNTAYLLAIQAGLRGYQVRRLKLCLLRCVNSTKVLNTCKVQ